MSITTLFTEPAEFEAKVRTPDGVGGFTYSYTHVFSGFVKIDYRKAEERVTPEIPGAELTEFTNTIYTKFEASVDQVVVITSGGFAGRYEILHVIKHKDLAGNDDHFKLYCKKVE